MLSKMENRMGHKSAGSSVTKVRIVEVAQLFAHHGYKGTTTRGIAQLADLNEATLFRYSTQARVVLGGSEIPRGANQSGAGHADQPGCGR